MLWKNIKHHWKLWLNTFKIAKKYDVLIENGVTLKYIDSLRFGEKCTLQSGVYVYGSRFDKEVIFGNDVVIGMNGVILGDGGVVLGDGTHFGPNVILTTQYGDRKKSTGSHAALKYAGIKLGKNAWIGAGSVLMPGVELGDNCAVAPNSVVYGKWGSNITLSGNPAKPKKI